MWEKFRGQNRLCIQYLEALEDLRPGLVEAAAIAELKTNLPAEVVAHAEDCDSCQAATEIFWASRNMLTGPLKVAREEQQERADETSPWFATRAMAKIAERETQVHTASAEWSGAVSRLASRLVWVSALALLVSSTWVSTWVYDPQPQRGRGQSNTIVGQAAETPQYLFDSTTAPSNADDALASPVER